MLYRSAMSILRPKSTTDSFSLSNYYIDEKGKHYMAAGVSTICDQCVTSIRAYKYS